MIPRVEPDRTTGILLGAWALVDLLQIPLVLAVIGAWRLARPLGRAWLATAIAFGGYTAWAVLTARFVPFAPTGFVLLVLGTFAWPRRGATPEGAWAVGSLIAVVLFWIVPTAAVWAFRRRPAAPGTPARR
jgi:hypothetical protein